MSFVVEFQKQLFSKQNISLILYSISFFLLKLSLL